MRDNSQRARAQKRVIDLATQPMRALVNSLIEFVRVSSVSAGAGAVGALTTAEDESIKICEPYGFTSRPPGNATAIVLAPGGETQDRIAIGVMSPASKPAAAAGDAIAWTASGHTVKLEQDGNITITGKDGGTVTIAATTGAITIAAATGASVNINVGVGQNVNIGGSGALALALGQKVIDGVDAMLAGGVPVLNDGGANLKATMTFAWNAAKSAILATKAKGI
jgi:phage gp45-like